MAGSAPFSVHPAMPEPPYSADLLADFHAGALSDDVTAHVRSRLAVDPRAHEVLAALDRVSSELRAEGRAASEMPEDVATRLDAFIEDMTGR